MKEGEFFIMINERTSTEQLSKTWENICITLSAILDEIYDRLDLGRYERNGKERKQLEELFEEITHAMISDFVYDVGQYALRKRRFKAMGNDDDWAEYWEEICNATDD